MVTENNRKPEITENKPPFWLLIIWGVFAIWGLAYLTLYWAPSLGAWLSADNPDATQWGEKTVREQVIIVKPRNP